MAELNNRDGTRDSRLSRFSRLSHLSHFSQFVTRIDTKWHEF